MALRNDSRAAAPPLRRLLLVCTLALVAALAAPGRLGAEGSATLYPADTTSPYRANIEWRTTFYGSADSPDFNVLRRTLIKVYVEAGEHILLGSSGVGVPRGFGDINVYNPGVVRGAIGDEDTPPLTGAAVPPQPGAFANGFSCVAQRATPGNAARGRIGSREAELAGPNPENNLDGPGYRPCIYTAPATGIYDVVFSGPSGFRSNEEPRPSGAITPTAADLGLAQRASVTLWDVSVRRDRNSPVVERGRAFVYYVAGNTGGGGRNVISKGVVVTDFGFTYEVRYAGDPFGFIVYSNQYGFQDSDGTPLYHAILADPNASRQDQNELKELQGGVKLLPPEYPIFFDIPYGPVLDTLNIPRSPIIPAIASLAFQGSEGGNVTLVGRGGSFSFQSSQPGVYTVVLSRDGVDFSPDNPRNKLIRGIAQSAGLVTVPWDGRDNGGEVFPPGEYKGQATVQGGEIHFPFLDVENNVPGGPTIQLINPPDSDGDGDGDCPPWNGGCYGAFYDDRGYITADGERIGVEPGGYLCRDNVGRPPREPRSNPLLGFDSRTDQRSFGFPFDANPETICHPNGGFGDKKGLDIWTYYPSNKLTVSLRIIEPTAVTLRSFEAAAGADGVSVRWETGSELDTVGFHLLRAPTANRDTAARVTPALVLARGGAGQGAAYSWIDRSATPGVRYFYWLEELEVGGATNEYGPVAVAPAPGDIRARIWLPLLHK